ncbi:MAG TPA: acyl-CoA dehydrogenase family protein [Acidimicrobiales bacterium]|nr:acyl-CoA dehydrogenase family protein [Acidimicrobiales bacterium]
MTDVGLDDAHAQLRDLARKVFADRSPTTAIRALADDTLGFDPELWRTAAELGFTGLEIGEEHGGAGMSFREAAVVLDEMGRGLVPLPVLSSVVLGTGALLAAGSPAQQAEWLPAMAAGERRLAVAIGPDRHDVRVAGDRLHGSAPFVLDAHAADGLVVQAGGKLYLVPLPASGVTVTPAPMLDRTRRLADVAFDGAEVEPMPGSTDGASVVDWLLDRAAAALALDSHGGARRAMEISVEYAKERVQFDRPIGSFQAVKHKCADMLIAVETTRVAADAAARDVAPRPDGPRRWPSIAKAHATDAYAFVAGAGISVHGGIGFTWEHDMHLFVKRAKLDQALFGTPAFHRERYARLLLD